ncbi:MAG TPA: hypothetical protein DD490_01265, partial [Acidobacteria bacterium]|nr:hypothetical protein [Acidobacteriota bacterium]
AEIIRERCLRRDLIVGARKTILGATTTARPVTELIADLHTTIDHLRGRASHVHWETAGA